MPPWARKITVATLATGSPHVGAIIDSRVRMTANVPGRALPTLRGGSKSVWGCLRPHAGTPPALPFYMSDLRAARDDMVRRHIAARGIRAPAVLEAMGSVPREAFLPPELAEFAYEDSPLPIAHGQA